VVLFVVAAQWSYGVGVGSRLTLAQFTLNAASRGGDQPGLACGVTTPERPTVLDAVNWRPKRGRPSRIAAANLRPQHPASSRRSIGSAGCGQDGPTRGRQSRCAQRRSVAQDDVAGMVREHGLVMVGRAGSAVSLVIPLGLAVSSFFLLFVAAGYGISGRALDPSSTTAIA